MCSSDLYTTADEYKSVFENFIQNPWRPVLYTALFVLIKNIIAHLGTQEFPRIKIGTGAPSGGGAGMIDWVIGVPSQAERKILVESFENAVKAAEDIIENGCQKAMNDYN